MFTYIDNKIDINNKERTTNVKPIRRQGDIEIH